jgi:NDP-sugar pyrophosphorylase family protein
MKLVLLAGGKGKRMGESSNHTPKPILEYKGKNLIQHKIDALPDSITELIIIIGHLGDKIKEVFGDKTKLTSDKEVPITYATQTEQLGTAHALLQARSEIGNSPFVVLMGDDLYDKVDIENMIEHYNATKEWSVLLQRETSLVPYGKCIVDSVGYLREIIDDPEGKIESNNMYTGACLLTPEYFDVPMTKYIHSTEYGIPYTFIVVAKERNIKAFYTTNWKRITKPEDLE